LGLSVDERGERERGRERETERQRDRERLLNISLITRKTNLSFLVVVGVFLHYSLRNVLGLISFRDKKSHRTTSFIGH